MNEHQLDAWARAATLVGKGWSIVPIKRGTKRPPYKGWDQFWKRKPTQDEIAAWIRGGILDWGIMCGPISNLIVVDLDDQEARNFAMQQGLSSGPVVASGKGWHHYFLAEGNEDLVKSIEFGGMKMDVLTEGGMVLAAGSMHPSGSVYEWIDESESLMPLPGWVREGCRVQSGGASSEATREHASTVKLSKEVIPAHGSTSTVTEGKRNDLMYKIASSARGKEGLGFDDLLMRLTRENERVCSPPLETHEIKEIVQSAMKHAPGNKRYEITDEGNLQRLVDKLDGNLRYVINGGFWIAWNGKRWVEENDLMIEYLARLSNASMQLEANNPNINDEERKTLIKHHIRSMSYNRIQGVAKMARSEKRLWIESQELDSDPFLFNCPNGTIDLRTGQLKKHSRDDFITKMGEVNFKSELMDIPLAELMDTSWIRFCRGMFSDHETREMDDGTIEYLQRLMGYFLTGSTKEQKWFLWRGTGANGKSTTAKVMSRIFGDYQIYLDVKTFMKQGRNSEANMARSRGMRLVMTSEPSPGSQLDETLMKTATGGGQVEARYLYQKPFGYVPTWKIMMEANSRPQVSGGDEGNYRRIHELDFLGNFMNWPDEIGERYHYGYSKSIDADLSAEIELIFAWMVRGCLKWNTNGLGAPPRITKASTQYRDEMDPIQAFINDCCIKGKYHDVSARSVNVAYRMWANLNGEDPERSPRWLSFRLTEKGMEKCTIKAGVRGYRGMSLRPDVLAKIEADILR